MLPSCVHLTLPSFLSRLSHPLSPRRALLALDYGTAHIGVACASSLEAPAEALTTLHAHAPGWGLARGGGSSPTPLDGGLVAALRTLIEARRVGGLVVGWPADARSGGALTPECERTLGFLRGLQSARLLTPVILWDEHGSSAAARAQLRSEQAPPTRRRTTVHRQVLAPERRARVDQEAAALILRSFLAAAQRHEGARRGFKLGGGMGGVG